MLKTIIFDFDGTLGNTYNINLGICREIIPDLTKQEFEDIHNGNVYQSKIRQWRASDLQIKFDFDKQKIRFTKAHLFPLEKELAELTKKYQLLIISSTVDENVRYFLSLGGWQKYFQNIFGATTQKSKIKKFQMMFKQYHLQPKECLFVTDTIGDIKEANKVGIDSVAVTWGYHKEKLLSTQKPYAIVNNPEELLKIIGKYAEREQQAGKTNNASLLNTHARIFDGYRSFLDKLFTEIEARGIDITGFQLDHLAYRTESEPVFTGLKPKFAKFGRLVHEGQISGNTVCIYKLHQPLSYRDQNIPAVELIGPHETINYPTGFEHAEFIIEESFEDLIDKYPSINWDKSALVRPVCPMLKLALGKFLQVKFIHEPILEIAGKLKKSAIGIPKKVGNS